MSYSFFLNGLMTSNHTSENYDCDSVIYSSRRPWSNASWTRSPSPPINIWAMMFVWR